MIIDFSIKLTLQYFYNCLEIIYFNNKGRGDAETHSQPPHEEVVNIAKQGRDDVSRVEWQTHWYVKHTAEYWSPRCHRVRSVSSGCNERAALDSTSIRNQGSKSKRR